MVLTKEQKKAKILKYLDEEAKQKKFRVEQFTIAKISENTELNEDEVEFLLNKLIEDGSIKGDKLVYGVYIPQGEYKSIKQELSEMEFYPVGGQIIILLLLGITILWSVLVATNIYKEILLDSIDDPILGLSLLGIFIVVAYVIGIIINKIYVSILSKNETIRDIATKIKPLVFTGIFIWIIMLIPFGGIYYGFNEQYKGYALIYLVITIPTTIIASIGVQDYLARVKIKGKKKN